MLAHFILSHRSLMKLLCVCVRVCVFHLSFYLLFCLGNFHHSAFQIACAFSVSSSLLFIAFGLLFVSEIDLSLFDWVFFIVYHLERLVGERGASGKSVSGTFLVTHNGRCASLFR